MKKIILSIYNSLIPKDSFLRHRIYSMILWKFFTEPIDLVLDKYFKHRDGCLFIQVGSNDGIIYDRLRKFIFKYDLEGVLVEPVDFLFEKLKKNYKSQNNLSFENIAISEKDGVKKFFHVESKKSIKGHSFLSLFGSFDKTHIHNVVNGKCKIEEKWIECKGINYLMQKYGTSELSLLMIDTEGHDYQIIKGIDFDVYSIDMIIYEEKNLSPSEKVKCKELLSNRGYTFVYEPVDVLAIKSSVFDKIN